ncbi:MAG: hypothetical protein H6P98_419, partial [Candidatus Aminicenantes bacterium]|nr:hypothetical protein [Candidatus Aminicenantes bacterium]
MPAPQGYGAGVMRGPFQGEFFYFLPGGSIGQRLEKLGQVLLSRLFKLRLGADLIIKVFGLFPDFRQGFEVVRDDGNLPDRAKRSGFGIGILIGDNIDPAGPGVPDERDGLLHQSPVVLAADLEMGDIGPDSRLLGDPDGLPDSVTDNRRLVPHMACVNPAEFADDFGEGDDLLRLGVAVGDVLQPGAHAPGTLPQPLTKDVLHLLEFPGCRVARLDLQDGLPDGPETDEQGRVRPDALLLPLGFCLGDIERPLAAVARDHGGDALGQVIQVGAGLGASDGEVAVGVHVDKPWRGREALGVESRFRRLAAEIPNSGDRVPLDPDIPIEP